MFFVNTQRCGNWEKEQVFGVLWENVLFLFF